MFRDLFVSGQLALHCKSLDELGFEMVEQIWEQYLEENQVSDEDFVKHMQIYSLAQQLTNEIVYSVLI